MSVQVVYAASGADCPQGPQFDTAYVNRLVAQGQPDRGLLWEVEQAGKKSYVYGTVHLAKFEWGIPGPIVTKALVNSSRLLLEIDPASSAVQDIFVAQGGGTKRKLTEEERAFRRRVSAQFKALCLDETQVKGGLSQKLAVLQMYVAARDGVRPEFGLEPNLAAFARATGKQVLGLETAAEQRAALSSERTYDEVLNSIETGEDRTSMLRWLNAWASSDAETISIWLDTYRADKIAAVSLLERNQRLAERAESHFRESVPVFLAVGVLHTMGPGNVLELLEKRGYKIRRLI